MHRALAGLLSPNLHELLQTAPPTPSMPSSGCAVLGRAKSVSRSTSNPRSGRHAPGDIWKQVLIQSVFEDLAGVRTSGSSLDEGNDFPRRRFLRLQHYGLSGLLFYDLGSTRGDDPILDDNSATGAKSCLTLATVLGSPGSVNGGMDVDGLLDAVSARVVYFPVYACTSFVAGQAMSAFLSQAPGRTPVPTHDGFSVSYLEPATPAFELGDIRPPTGLENLSLSSEEADFPSMELNFARMSFLGELHDSADFKLPEHDPHVSLFVRSSSAESVRCEAIEQRHPELAVDEIVDDVSIEGGKPLVGSRDAAHLELEPGCAIVLGAFGLDHCLQHPFRDRLNSFLDFSATSVAV